MRSGLHMTSSAGRNVHVSTTPGFVDIEIDIKRSDSPLGTVLASIPEKEFRTRILDFLRVDAENDTDGYKEFLAEKRKKEERAERNRQAWVMVHDSNEALPFGLASDLVRYGWKKA